MTLLVPPPALGLLQGALTTAIGGVSTEASGTTLSSIRGIEGFGGISNLTELTRPDNLARLAGNPAILRTVAQVLNLPAHVEREISQTPQSANYRPTSCAMDWEGADLADHEVADLDRTAQRTPAEIAHSIFTDIHELQGKLRIGPLEQRIREHAEELDLRQGVQIYRRAPTAINEKLHELLNMAYLISKIMDDGDPQGEYRDGLHRNHSRSLIVDYLSKARERKAEAEAEKNPDAKQIKSFDDAIGMLEKSLSLYDQVYGGTVNLGVLQNSMSRAIKDMLVWPKEVTLENLGAFAVSVRQSFDAHAEDLTGEQRYHLMRLAIALDGAAFGLGAFNEGEAGTQTQALKLATLIEVLYGTGFGDERWLAVAERLRGVFANWAALGPHQGAEELARYGVLAAHMLDEGKTSYHSLFDALVRTNGKKWGLSENDMRSFTRSLYRTGALFPLGQHLAALHAGNGNHNRVDQILERLHQDRVMSRVYAPVFLGDGKKEDLLHMGNKGKGLNELIKMGEAVPAGFALPPVLVTHDDLSDEQKAEINSALDELEKRTGKNFEDDTLMVSVRSGSSVSMPGTLLTITRVSTRHEVLRGILAVYRSWNNPSAQLYRRMNGVPEDFGTSVIVQEWIETDDHPDSGFGLATSDGSGDAPLTRYGRKAHGIDLVSGYHSGRDDMEEDVKDELNRKIQNYEDHFHHPVEVEYAVERGKIWMLQIRRAQLRYEDEIRWAARMIRSGRMSKEDGVAFLGGQERLTGALNEPRLLLQGSEELIAQEAKGGGRPMVGSIAFDEAGIATLQSGGLQAIFVTDNADAGKSAAYAFEAGAAIFNEGNGVSHLEGDLRASNRPHVGGIAVTIDRHARTVSIAGNTLREGDVVTLDPANGSIYRGQVPIQEGDSPVASIIRWLIG